MGDALWQWDDLVRAAAGAADGTPDDSITGFSLDTRSIRRGEVFVALKDVRDGHEFVGAAFAAGAAAALVSIDYVRKPGDGALVRVGDTLKGLENIARAARARLSADARVIAVTGSVGKTGTSAMLRACLERVGATHAPEKSFNNHWGVPLTLARMPADTRFAVIEIGMNHAGEITPLSKLARPNVALITTVEPVHLAQFASIEAIADAKAEIFLGLERGGTAVLNRDNPHFERLAGKAKSARAQVVAFGRQAGADVRPSRWDIGAEGSDIVVTRGGSSCAYRLAAPGAHLAMNSLGVVAALQSAGADLEVALPALAIFEAPQGRGARVTLALPGGGTALLIDESYNANPASDARRPRHDGDAATHVVFTPDRDPRRHAGTRRRRGGVASRPQGSDRRRRRRSGAGLGHADAASVRRAADRHPRSLGGRRRRSHHIGARCGAPG